MNNLFQKTIDPNSEIKLFVVEGLMANLEFIYKNAEIIVQKYRNAKIYMYLDDHSFSKVSSNEYIKIKKFVTHDFYKELSDKHIAIVNTNFEGFQADI